MKNKKTVRSFAVVGNRLIGGQLITGKYILAAGKKGLIRLMDDGRKLIGSVNLKKLEGKLRGSKKMTHVRILIAEAALDLEKDFLVKLLLNFKSYYKDINQKVRAKNNARALSTGRMLTPYVRKPAYM